MNSTDRQRGKHPNDNQLFSAKWQEVLKEAVDDQSFLLSRGYGANSALALVGNRYRLNKVQLPCWNNNSLMEYFSAENKG